MLTELFIQVKYILMIALRLTTTSVCTASPMVSAWGSTLTNLVTRQDLSTITEESQRDLMLSSGTIGLILVSFE